MSDVFFLILRRLRAPLIVLISVYAIGAFGMTLMPGVDPDGNVWYMSFFHAFYFISYTGSTIGFGEIPYTYSDAQRAWALVSIYTSVIAWLYAIGNLLRLIQDPTFQHAIFERGFQRSIRRIDAPFHIICGFGETGMLVNRGLNELGVQTVIIDRNSERTSLLEIESLPLAPVVLTADATLPRTLLNAGLNHPCCVGVLALTQDDHVNLQIAVSCKLLNKKVPVICRSEHEDEAANMASFGTDIIINPFQTFTQRLNMLVHHPQLHRIQNWFINQQSAEHLADREVPLGRWILCGFGRLGKAIAEELQRDGIELIVVDPDPIASGAPDDAIIGRGTEANTLQEAGIMQATMVIAASDDDANNLSVLITAKHLNPEIYTIGRVSREANQALFAQADCDYIMRRSQLVANQAMTAISRPLVTRFIKYSSTLTDRDTEQLTEDIHALCATTDPITWRLVLDQELAPALFAHMQSGSGLILAQLSSHHELPQARCIPLLLQRGGVSHLLPGNDTELQPGDELLFAGHRRRILLPLMLRDNEELIDTLLNKNTHHIPLLRWWSRRQTAQTEPPGS